MTKQLKGSVKWTKAGELVAELDTNDSRFINVGRDVIEVAGVNGKVRLLGKIFGRKQYAYLKDASGAIPAKPEPAQVGYDGTDPTTEHNHAI